MAHETALVVVNQTKTQLATTARAIVNALQDGKVSPMEGMALGMQGMALATHLITMFQGTDAATRNDILYVLEHGQWTLPEGV